MKRLPTIAFAVITALLLVSCAKEPTKSFTLDDDTKEYIWVSPIPIEDVYAEWPGFGADEWVEGAPHVWHSGILGFNVEGHYSTLSFATGMATKTDYRYLEGHNGKDFDGTEIDILQPFCSRYQCVEISTPCASIVRRRLVDAIREPKAKTG